MIKLDKKTACLMQMEVEGILEDNKGLCTLSQAANALAGSKSVFKSYAEAQKRVKSYAAAQKRVTQERGTGGAGFLDWMAGATRNQIDTDELLHSIDSATNKKIEILEAFSWLESSHLASSTSIRSWEEAQKLLSLSFVFPAQSPTQLNHTQKQHRQQAYWVPHEGDKIVTETAKSASGNVLEESEEQPEQERIEAEEERASSESARRQGIEAGRLAEERAEDHRRAEEFVSSLLRAFTPQEESIIAEEIYGSGPDNEVVHAIGSDSVQRGSMSRLKPCTWLNDEVIHYYLCVLLSKRDEEMCKLDPSLKRSHFFKSFFMTKLLLSEDMYGWSNHVPGKDIFNLDKIFFPVNQGETHWICAVVFMQEKRIQMYDSCGGPGMHYLENIFRYLKDEHQDKKKCPLPDADQWTLVPCTTDTPRQANCKYSSIVSIVDSQVL